MFRCPTYLLDSIRKLMVRNGDLDLLSEYIVVGLGGGFNILPQMLSDVVDVSGYARTIRTYTGYFKDVKISVIAIAGGLIDAEWISALAYMKKAKILIGIGWCGALQKYIDIGDAVIPIATIRDENTSLHYVDPGFPAIGDPILISTALKKVKPRIESLGSKLWLGITVSTSSMLTETPERIEKWMNQRALCIDVETSTIYTMTYLAGIPSLVLLAVSDNVVLGKDCGFETELSRKVDNTYRELVKSAFEIILDKHYSFEYG